MLNQAQFSHICNADPAQGKVCSHLVTDAQLGDMGHPVAKFDKVVGTPVLVTPGTQRNKAVHAAWSEGHVRICTKTGGTQC